MVTYTVGAAFGGARTGVTLVLAGVAVVSFTSAVQTFLLQRNLEVFREVFRWITGSSGERDVGRRGAGVSIRSRERGRVAAYTAGISIVFRVGGEEAATLGVRGGTHQARRS